MVDHPHADLQSLVSPEVKLITSWSKARTINHIVKLSSVAQGPQVDKDSYQAEYSKGFKVTFQEPRTKARLLF